MSPFTLVLPYPPSANEYYRSVTIGNQARVLISGEGRRYMGEVALACLQQRAPRDLSMKLALDVLVRAPAFDKNGRKCGAERDLDNFLKPLLDALKCSRKEKAKNYGVFLDDRQIDDLRVRRGERINSSAGVVLVTVTPMGLPGLLDDTPRPLKEAPAAVADVPF